MGHSFIFVVGVQLQKDFKPLTLCEDSDSWRFLGPKADPWEFLAKTNFCVDYKILGGLRYVKVTLPETNSFSPLKIGTRK